MLGVTGQHVVSRGALGPLSRRGSGLDLASSPGPCAAPGDGINALAAESAVGHAPLLPVPVLGMGITASPGPRGAGDTGDSTSASTLLTSMCSPSRLPLREKLEQLSISSVLAQRATAVECRESPERADHTERQSSCSSATGPGRQRRGTPTVTPTVTLTVTPTVSPSARATRQAPSPHIQANGCTQHGSGDIPSRHTVL